MLDNFEDIWLLFIQYQGGSSHDVKSLYKLCYGAINTMEEVLRRSKLKEQTCLK